MLRQARHKGAFVKHCPCSPGAVACGYFNLNLHSGCPFSCSYCILQVYLENKEQGVFYGNRADMEAELETFLAAHDAVRIGSGEFSDSLAYEDVRASARRTVELFRRWPRAVFEFKTKATQVRPLLSLREVPANIVVSWSLNPDEIIRGEEPGTPGLAQRLAALAAVQEKGYRVGIHFDPLILIPNWRHHYRGLINELARIIRPDRVAWWSLGALRFPPELKKRIFERRDSRLFWGELIQGADGKYRYFTPLRLELFAFIRDEIRRRLSSEIPLYLCMEDAATWKQVLPDVPADEKAINRRLFESALG